MADNKRARAPLERDQINIKDPNEMRMWIKAFGIPAEKLEAAVLVVGTDALKVRLYLSKQA